MARLSGIVNRVDVANGIGLLALEGMPDVVHFSVIRAGAFATSAAGRRGRAWPSGS